MVSSIQAYQKEARLTGYVRSVNQATNHSVHSEETKMIRPYSHHGVSPFRAADDSFRYSQKKNEHLSSLYLHNVQDPRKIIRPSYSQAIRLPMAPHPNNVWAKTLQNVPTLSVDRTKTTYPTENKFWLFRDSYGHAFAAPEHGRSYVWPNLAYFGNPWGAGNVLYQHLRQGGQKDDGYVTKNKKKNNITKNFNEYKKNPTYHADWPKKKKVTFKQGY